MMQRLNFAGCPAGAALVAALVVASTPGCGTETGMVIEVTKGELAAAPDSLRFFVGVDAGEPEIAVPVCGTVARFVDESDEARAVVAVGGRDLAADPYRLLLRPDEALPLDQDVMVVVVALKGEEVLGMGSLQAPARFISDTVVAWQVQVNPLADGSALLGSGCACARLGSGGAVAVTPTDDRDCDGDVGSDDCNDHDATVGPSKSELCENAVDDDCDGEADEPEDADGDTHDNCNDCDDRNPDVHFGAIEVCDGYDTNCTPGDEYPDHVPCYAQDGGQCYLGKRVCNDLDPLSGGWQTECTPVSTDPGYVAPRELCDTFDVCIDTLEYRDGFECANREYFTTVQCIQWLQTDLNGGNTQLCAGSEWQVPGPLDTVCTTTLLGGTSQGPYVAELISDPPGQVGAVVQDCQPVLKIRELSAEPYPSSIRLWLQTEQALISSLELQITPMITTEVCPQEGGLICTAAARAAGQ